MRATTRSSVAARCRASTTSRTVGCLANRKPVIGSSGACSWSPRVRSTSRMVCAGTGPLRVQARPPSPSAMTMSRTTKAPMQARPPTRMRFISLPLHASERLGPDAEFLVRHHDLMEPTDEGSRAQIRRLVMMHDLDNLLKTLDHRFLEPRVHQREFVDTVQHLLPNGHGKGAVCHGFNARNHLPLGTDTNALFHQPKTYMRDVFDPFEIAYRHPTSVGIDVRDNDLAPLAQDGIPGRCRGTIGPLRDERRLDASGILGGHLGL